MEHILNKILEEVKEIRIDISVLKSDISVLKSDISVLKSDVSMLKSDVSKLNEKVDILEGKSDEQRDLLLALEHRTEENTAQLHSLAENINYIKGDIKKGFDNHKKQERLLERLSLRSIEHEADIAHLSPVR
ncbi:MAG: hypothetical protein VR72_20145 [Clostridiaceae bacterium BRH_c20a]|nr:MAG: hypothetical protein VR72_20145 [Clostridiaceae bacterium BRH_c20a]